jgi:ABC-2 type transport system permease protein
MTTVLRDNARILRHSFVTAIADYRAFFTWKTWIFAWLVRLLCQVALFAMLGRLIGSPEKTAYLLIGNAVFVAATSVMLVCSSTGLERSAGTLPLLVAAPSSFFTVFVGRSAQWVLDGLACSTISLFLLGAVFGIYPPMPVGLLAIPLIAVITVSIYSFGLVLGALAMRAMELRSLVGNLGSLVLMVLTGVQVSTSFWPVPLGHVAQVLPITHGLQGMRDLFAGSTTDLGRQVALELVVALGWMLVAAFTFWRFAESGRKDGSIEFGG